MRGLTRLVQIVAAGIVLGIAGIDQGTTSTSDVLASFTPAKRAAVGSGRPIVDVVPKQDVDLAVIGAVRTTADAERLVAWVREAAQLQRGRYIPVIQRFSDPPQLADLDALIVEEDELEEMGKCRRGRCGVKLAAEEMEQMRIAIRAAGSDWRPVAQDAFRRIVLARALDYLAAGFAGALPYDDHRKTQSPATEFEALLEGCRLPGLETPEVTRYLRTYPASHTGEAESFLYWSRDTFGDAKPIVGITHVSIFTGRSAHDPTVVAAVQVFATHYLTASLSLTAVVDGADDERYLMYTRRSNTDVFGGPFGGLIRRMVQKRIRAEGPVALDSMRRKLEGGLPLSSAPR